MQASKTLFFEDFFFFFFKIPGLTLSVRAQADVPRMRVDASWVGPAPTGELPQTLIPPSLRGIMV